MRRLGGAALGVLAACTPSPRDVVPESHEVRVTPDGGAAQPVPEDAYVYVARRPHGAIARLSS